MIEIFFTTILKRPYVLAFLISYIVIAWRTVGKRWTTVFFMAGYAIAFVSEFLSINYGLPYGWYFYIYENLQGEWLNHGVPVWDSASYVFMNFAGLTTARIALRRKTIQTRRDGLILVMLAAVFVVILDVVVDPVAHLGEFWFLGKIYYYPNPGIYFDVTLANFAGWFMVSVCINAAGVFVLGFNKLEKLEDKTNRFLSLGLYYGIFAFGLGVAVYLKHWSLVLCDLFWIGGTITTLIFANRRFFT